MPRRGPTGRARRRASKGEAHPSPGRLPTSRCELSHRRRPSGRHPITRSRGRGRAGIGHRPPPGPPRRRAAPAVAPTPLCSGSGQRQPRFRRLAVRSVIRVSARADVISSAACDRPRDAPARPAAPRPASGRHRPLPSRPPALMPPSTGPNRHRGAGSQGRKAWGLATPMVRGRLAPKPGPSFDRHDIEPSGGAVTGLAAGEMHGTASTMRRRWQARLARRRPPLPAIHPDLHPTPPSRPPPSLRRPLHRPGWRRATHACRQESYVPPCPRVRRRGSACAPAVMLHVCARPARLVAAEPRRLVLTLPRGAGGGERGTDGRRLGASGLGTGREKQRRGRGEVGAMAEGCARRGHVGHVGSSAMP
jgi:hypothetical protein